MERGKERSIVRGVERSSDSMDSVSRTQHEGDWWRRSAGSSEGLRAFGSSAVREFGSSRGRDPAASGQGAAGRRQIGNWAIGRLGRHVRVAHGPEHEGRFLAEMSRKTKGVEIITFPRFPAWWSYRDSNPSFSLERAAS